MSEQKEHSEPSPTPPSDYDEGGEFIPYDVTCARCGRVGPCHLFIIEEGDEWECPECWERCNREEHARARQT
jgi:hypothetical protein